MSEAAYPCIKCGKLRTKAEGGTVFTVCDDCWDKKNFDEKTQRKAKRFMSEDGENDLSTTGAVRDAYIEARNSCRPALEKACRVLEGYAEDHADECSRYVGDPCDCSATRAENILDYLKETGNYVPARDGSD